jgi:hypothetical protein
LTSFFETDESKPPSGLVILMDKKGWLSVGKAKQRPNIKVKI